MSRAKERGSSKPPWRPLSRRAFVAMLGAAAAALAVRERAPSDDDPPREPWTGTTRWIGHC